MARKQHARRVQEVVHHPRGFVLPPCELHRKGRIRFVEPQDGDAIDRRIAAADRAAQPQANRLTCRHFEHRRLIAGKCLERHDARGHTRRGIEGEDLVVRQRRPVAVLQHQAVGGNLLQADLPPLCERMRRAHDRHEVFGEERLRVDVRVVGHVTQQANVGRAAPQRRVLAQRRHVRALNRQTR